MKKLVIAAAAALCATFAHAQVDSTNSATQDTTSQTAQDTTPQSATSGAASDTTAQNASTMDSTAAGGSSSGMANAADSAGISEDDLRKYAVTMDSINSMKKALLEDITRMVKENGSMKLARYNELNKAMKDEAKLKELKATPEEIAFMQSVDQRKNEGAQQISETFQTLAKDYVGVEKYNEIKTSLTTDPDLKARYDQIMSEVSQQDAASARE